MKIYRPANPLPLNSIVTLVVGIFLLSACGIFSRGGDRGIVAPPHPTLHINRTPPAVSARWVLVSATAIPEVPHQGWSYDSQSSSASYQVDYGGNHNFQWARPPQQIDQDGFTVSFSAQCQSQMKKGCASQIGIAGDGLKSDTPDGEWKAEAYGENGALGSGKQSVYFIPSLNSNELEVEIELMRGAVRFIYKYQRAE